MAKPNTNFKIENVRVTIKSEYNNNYKRLTRRITLWFDDIEDVPVELFEFKVSQSDDPEKNGKMVFSHLSMYTDENPKGDNLVPINNASLVPKGEKATPLEKIKHFMVNTYQPANPETKYKAYINVNGKYLNVYSKPDGIGGDYQPYIIFNIDQFPGDTDKKPEENSMLGVPLLHGKYPGYFRNNTKLDVTLRSTANPKYPNNYFYNAHLSSDTLTGLELIKYSRPGTVAGENLNHEAIEHAISADERKSDDLSIGSEGLETSNFDDFGSLDEF